MFVSGYLISFLNKCNTEEKSHLCTIRLKKNMIYFFFLGNQGINPKYVKKNGKSDKGAKYISR